MDRLAAEGDPKAIDFPVHIKDSGLDFVWGLKTAAKGLKSTLRGYKAQTPQGCRASVQAAITDVLVAKTLRVAQNMLRVWSRFPGSCLQPWSEGAPARPASRA